MNFIKQLWQSGTPRFLRHFTASSYLYRLIWLGFLSATIPVILAGSAYYHFSMNKLTSEFQTNNMASLTQIKDRIESSLSNVEHDSLQISSSTLIRSALDNPDYGTAYFQQLDILDLFQLHKNTNDLIEDILFYDLRNHLLLSHSYGLVRLADYDDRLDIEMAIAAEYNSKWTYLPRSKERNGYISYVRHLPVMSPGRPQGIIIVQAKEKTLRNLLQNYAIGMDQQSLAIFDAQRRILLHTEGPDAITEEDMTGDPILNTVMEDPATFNHYLLQGDKDKELVAFHETSMGRLYVSRMPEQAMIEKLHWIKVLIFFSISIFVLIAILLTVFSSRLAYNPIQQLLAYGKNLGRNKVENNGEVAVQPNEIEYIRSSLTYLNEQAESLDRYIRGIEPDLHDLFLQRLLMPNGSWRRGTLEDECKSHGINGEGRFIVLVVRAENLVKKRFLPNESPVILFAIKNVMSEILMDNKELEGHITDKDEREAVAILRFEEERGQHIRTNSWQYARAVHDALENYLSFSSFIGIGQAYTLHQLGDSYKDAKTALQYQLFSDTGPVLFYEDMIRMEGSSIFLYPKDVENEIIEYLWSDELQLAETSLHEFYRRIRSSDSYNIVFQSYHMLLSAIIQSKEDKGAGFLDILKGNLFEQLKDNQTSREMHEWFIGVLFPLCREIGRDLRSNSTRAVVQEVCNHITNHPESNHSLAECAELVNMSPSYLSRTFKKETGVSFIEYVMNYKVQRARQLLADTDYTVTEIAEMVGYSERNLNRTFQRFMNMSPRQYRMSVR
ncbi:helix-turn-helix domain-containing protein [Paenibacillus urinalis]|uniref:helix-turn-helix domain-containing protein n=1 Tax=Paenibacillus urinalis TaxID=521520 RepID=UPI001961F58B